MADEGFAWIYLLFFLIIPLSRVIPRLIQKMKNKNQESPDQYTQRTYQSTNDTFSDPPRKSFQAEIPKEMNPKTQDMLVLGELNRGTKNFNSIQKNLGMDSSTLEKILESLENQGLMRVQNKQGIFGTKVELIITDKGFKKFYS